MTEIRGNEIHIGVAMSCKLVLNDLQRVLFTTFLNVVILKVAMIGANGFKIAQHCLG